MIDFSDHVVKISDKQGPLNSVYLTSSILPLVSFI
jgi:hypothetical protein